ncbi:MAG: TetR/AcrR family transcriptional regulator [Rhodospirillales bacterium]|nr:TetR/AcrR family transcriptional regulator [Rhodospirillales bacterium]
MAEVEELGKQQAKSLRARAAICDATINSLIEYGYGETSLNQVAKLSGFSKGALQHHFPSKEDMMVATADRLLERPFTLPSQEKDKPKSIEEAILLPWKKLIYTGAYRALLEILIASRTDLKLQERLSEKLQKWNEALDQQAVEIYRSKTGNQEDVKILMTMNRSLMRGLVIQDSYGADSEATMKYIYRWIELISPFLELKE